MTTAAKGHLGMELSFSEQIRRIIADFEAATDVFPLSGATTTPTTVTTTVARTALTAAPETVTSEARPVFGATETEMALDLAEAVDGRDHHGPDQVLVAGKASAEIWFPQSSMTELSILAQARLAVGLPSFSAGAEPPVVNVTKAKPHIEWSRAVVKPVPGRGRGAETSARHGRRWSRNRSKSRDLTKSRCRAMSDARAGSRRHSGSRRRSKSRRRTKSRRRDKSDDRARSRRRSKSRRRTTSRGRDKSDDRARSRKRSRSCDRTKPSGHAKTRDRPSAKHTGQGVPHPFEVAVQRGLEAVSTTPASGSGQVPKAKRPNLLTWSRPVNAFEQSPWGGTEPATLLVGTTNTRPLAAVSPTPSLFAPPPIPISPLPATPKRSRNQPGQPHPQWGGAVHTATIANLAITTNS